MKSIKEAEALTGISRQNIRYYEKMGLLNPKRDAGNGYRKYDEEDIERLKAILLFRKLDMPLEEIHKLLDCEIDLPSPPEYLIPPSAITGIPYSFATA